MKTKTTLLNLIAAAIFSLFVSSETNAQITLYGCASGGGAYSVGTIFSITPYGNINTFCNLNSTFAAVPAGGLLFASDGNFYGSGVDGGYADSCCIFSCSRTGTLRTAIDLDSVWGSSDPVGNSLIQATDGNLYGMTTMGGTGSYGVIFQLQLSGHYSPVHFFTGTDGSSPYGSLIQTPDGTLWGMTSSGGTNTLGNIFSCSTTGTFTSAYNFSGTTDGSGPHGDLLLAADGNFYGLTSAGGKYGYGTLFRYSPTGTFTKLVDFNDTNGSKPLGSLIQASDGNFYGLTSAGGNLENRNGYGTLFIYTSTGSLITLMQFNDSLNGATPYGSLMQASDGNLYGTTSAGGTYNMGTVFQYSLTHVYTKLADLNTATGATPKYGKLIEVDNLFTGMNTISSSNVGIYPNPNNGSFTMHLSGVSGQATIEIFNELGEKVYSSILPQNSKGALSEINLGNQSNGLYFYKVISENGGDVASGKFVIEK